MHGILSKTTMLNIGDKAKNLASSLFGLGEIKNRIAKNAMKVLISDIATLSSEFQTAKGDGALFFNPSDPNRSQYLTLKDIQNDIALAEELCDSNTANFLKKLINMVQKDDNKKNPVVVMVDYNGLSAHKLDLNSLDERIEGLINAVSK